MIAYIIYLSLCAFSGFIMAESGIEISTWKRLAILGCVIGSYICGKYQE